MFFINKLTDKYSYVYKHSVKFAIIYKIIKKNNAFYCGKVLWFILFTDKWFLKKSTISLKNFNKHPTTFVIHDYQKAKIYVRIHNTSLTSLTLLHTCFGKQVEVILFKQS